MANNPDIDLVRRSSFGDREAFAELVRKYSNFIYSVAFSILNDFHTAQDTTQETFVKAWFNIEKLQEHDKFGSWLVSTAKRIS